MEVRLTMVIAFVFVVFLASFVFGDELVKLPKEITYSSYSSRGRPKFDPEQCKQNSKDLGLEPDEVQKIADVLSKKWRVTIRTQQKRIFVVTRVESQSQSFSFTPGEEFTKEADKNFIIGKKTKSLYNLKGNTIIGKDTYENGQVVELEAIIDRFELLLTIKTKSMACIIIVQRD